MNTDEITGANIMYGVTEIVYIILIRESGPDYAASHSLPGHPHVS
jgi:hypothetical protein